MQPSRLQRRSLPIKTEKIENVKDGATLSRTHKSEFCYAAPVAPLASTNDVQEPLGALANGSAGSTIAHAKVAVTASQKDDKASTASRRERASVCWSVSLQRSQIPGGSCALVVVVVYRVALRAFVDGLIRHQQTGEGRLDLNAK